MAVVLSTSLRLLVRHGAGDAARDGLVLRYPRLTPKDPLDPLPIHSNRTETKIQHVRIDCIPVIVNVLDYLDPFYLPPAPSAVSALDLCRKARQRGPAGGGSARDDHGARSRP